MQYYNSQSEEEGSSVNLSYGRNLTASNRKLVLQCYRNGEMKVMEHVKSNPTPPPPREGGVTQTGLTSRAKSKIKRSARMMAHESKCSFITLTYGKDYPNDATAKTHIDRFFKRIRRLHGNIPYTWVAERQKRGAIHFHILTNRYIARKDLHRHWNGVVSAWLYAAGKEPQEVQPNVVGVRDAGRYMAKYMSKGGYSFEGNMYAISQAARQLMKPVAVYSFQLPDQVYGNEMKYIEEAMKAKNVQILPIETETTINDDGELVPGRLIGLFIPATGTSVLDTLLTVVTGLTNTINSS